MLLFLENALALVGFAVHVIFAAPVVILLLLWELLYWIGGILGPFFVWIWSLLVAVNWAGLFYVFGMGMLCLVGIVVTFWLLYRLGLFLFNRGCFTTLIEKSCKYREERRAKINARIAERREKRLAEKEQDKYYKEHKKVIDAKK